MLRWGAIRRNRLPKITLPEHDWLCKNHPGLAAFTRCYDYSESEWVEDTDRPSRAQPSTVREVWVGAVNPDATPAQAEQEEMALLTDLQTELYSNQAAFDQWLDTEVTKFLEKHRPRLVNNQFVRNKTRRAILLEYPFPRDRDGDPVPAMIEDPQTGELRPIQVGDTLTTARTSNDNLDSLYMDEPSDPRMQNDWSAFGSDHRWSDRFAASSGMEDFLVHAGRRLNGRGGWRLGNDGRFYEDRPSQAGTWRSVQLMPSSAMPEGLRDIPDDLSVRRSAQRIAERAIERNPDLAGCQSALTDEAEARIRLSYADVRFNEQGDLVSGYFWDKQEYFAEVDRLHARCTRPKTKGPAPIDWGSVRAAQSKIVHEPRT